MDLFYVSKGSLNELYLAEGFNGSFNIFDATQRLIETRNNLNGYKKVCDVNKILDSIEREK